MEDIRLLEKETQQKLALKFQNSSTTMENTCNSDELQSAIPNFEQGSG